MSELKGLEDLADVSLKEYNQRIVRLERLVHKDSANRPHLVEWTDSIKEIPTIRDKTQEYMDTVNDEASRKWDFSSQLIGTAIIRGLIKQADWRSVLHERKSLFARLCMIVSAPDSFLFSSDADSLLEAKNSGYVTAVYEFLKLEKNYRIEERVLDFLLD